MLEEDRAHAVGLRELHKGDGHLQELQVAHDHLVALAPRDALRGDVQPVRGALDEGDVARLDAKQRRDVPGRLLPRPIHPQVVLGSIPVRGPRQLPRKARNGVLSRRGRQTNAGGVKKRAVSEAGELRYNGVPVHECAPSN